MYKKGIITFDNNDALARAAYEAGAYFSENLDFTPATTDNDQKIFEILKAGNRQKILDAINTYGKEMVRLVAIEKLSVLPQGVVNMLEGIFNIQLTIDGGM